MSNVRALIAHGAALAAVCLFLIPARAADEASPLDDWAVQPGFSLEVDATGFDIPTAIAFVPEPGREPDAPLYFVTELQGTIKVVTNDRTVRTFATVPTVGFQDVELRGSSQQGLAGLCLDPLRGDVFVTFTYPDPRGILRNGIVRFRTQPGRFGLAPEETSDFGDILSSFQAAPAHQIGGCVVRGGSLYVGVGDGGNVSASGNVNVLLGKVLRLSVDGTAQPDNPFHETGAADAPSSFVWAYGLRNPFGLTFVGERLFTAENGIRIDRVIEIERGAHHHWDGTDESIATGAMLVFPLAVSPVQFTAVTDPPAFLPPDLADHFLMAAFGGSERSPGVIAIGYDLEPARVRGVWKYLLTYRGDGRQFVIGLAVGPDALYVVPGAPDARGESVILKMRRDPANEHAVVIGTGSDRVADAGAALLQQHDCTNCHSTDGRGGGIGPSLDLFGLNWRLTERLNSKGYEASLAQLDALDEEPFVSFRQARQEVLAATGRDRTSIWLKYFLMEPRFDNPQAAMPNPKLTDAEAEALRNALYGEPSAPGGLLSRIREGVTQNPRAVAFGFASGISASIALVLVGGVCVMWRRR